MVVVFGGVLVFSFVIFIIFCRVWLMWLCFWVCGCVCVSFLFEVDCFFYR